MGAVRFQVSAVRESAQTALDKRVAIAALVALVRWASAVTTPAGVSSSAVISTAPAALQTALRRRVPRALRVLMMSARCPLLVAARARPVVTRANSVLTAGSAVMIAVFASLAGQLGCACDAAGACDGARCESNVCVACDGELGCPCDNGECTEGRCEANTCVACDGQAGCPCDNGECVDGLCGQDNFCVACEGQAGCACAGDSDCQAGLDCVNVNGALTCTDCAGELGCSCDNGACAGNLVCENNECAQPAVCPVGTEGCPCDGISCDGALNCLDRDGDGEATCLDCLGEVGCFCDTGARCTVGAECISGFCVEICDYAGCECEADGDCAEPLTCETTADGLRCRLSRTGRLCL